MKRKYLIAAAILTFATASAQNYTEPMKRLIGYVSELRTSDTDDSVYMKLINDNCWTLMDEIGHAEGECSPFVEMEKFGINDLAHRVESKMRGKYVSTSNFCDGTDPRYSYSFIEKSIMDSTTISYEIGGRTGLQTFVVVPFSVDYKLRVGVIVSENDYIGIVDPSGNIVIEFDAGNDAKRKFVLSIENKSGKDISYVILNYNSRTR